MDRAPDPCLPLATFTVLLLPHKLLFTPEVRILLLRNLVPFRFCSESSKSLKVRGSQLSNQQYISFLITQVSNSQISIDPNSWNQNSTLEVSIDAAADFVVAASDRSKGEMKMMVPMKTKNRRGRREEKMATLEKKKRKEKRRMALWRKERKEKKGKVGKEMT